MIYICEKCGEIKDGDFNSPDEIEGEILCEECQTAIADFIGEEND